MSEPKGAEPIIMQLATKYLLLVLLCYLLIVFAFLIAYSPLIPNEWWGPLAVVGMEFGFLRWMQVALRLYIASIPLFVTLAVGVWWFMHSLQPDPPSKTRLFWTTPLSCLLALPYFFQLPFFMAYTGFNLEFHPPGTVGLTIQIFFVTTLTFLLLLSTAISNHPFNHLKELLPNPLFWLSFILLCLAAYLAFMGVVFSALSGNEGVIYVSNFPQRLTGITVNTVPLAFLIPALLLTFIYPQYQGNPLLRKKSP